ncbi:hypothetical protein BDB01DRAFT_905383 [Pilobolus umbonatus]|nr:hypothetical protein BDB01DRAFT_905383 [Pilobolus umbonatus]
MERLPFELVEKITTLLDSNDYHSCLTVNKAWYTVFIPRVYRNITITKMHLLYQFLESLTSYPLCIEAASYIKRIDLSHNIYNNEDTYNTIIRAYLIDALVNCPNLEELLLLRTKGVLETMLHPDMPQLQMLKRLEFVRVLYNYDQEIRECYYKYRSALTHLHVKEGSDMYSRDKPIMIAQYFASFPCLTSLGVNLPQITFNGYIDFNLIDRILSQCTRLKDVSFTFDAQDFLEDGSVSSDEYIVTDPDSTQESSDEDTLISSDHSYTSTTDYFSTESLIIPIQSYPQIESLVLRAGHMDLKDICRAHSKFPGLQQLSLYFLSYPADYCDIIKEVMGMKRLNQLLSVIDASIDIDILQAFFNFTHLPSTHSQALSCNTAKITTLNTNYPESSMSYARCATTGTSTTTYSLECYENQLIPFLKVIGTTLNKLELCRSHLGNDPLLSRGLDDINRMCPSLIYLNLTSFVPNANHQLMAVNNNLETLTLSSCTLTSSSFRMFEQAYPKLQRLEIYDFHLRLDHNDDLSQSIWLPNTGLTSLAIDMFSCYGTYNNILVMKEKGHFPLISWHLDPHTKKMIISTGRDILYTIENLSLHAPLHVLRSTTLEDVCMKMCKYD